MMATLAKKQKLDNSDEDSLPICPYGAKCYRKNPEHFKQFIHKKSDKSEMTSTSTSDSTLTVDTSKLAPCKYGSNCYRTNLLHFAEYSHPFGSAPIKTGSDTEEYDSDSDSNTLQKEETQMKKTFSNMTDAERRKLVEDAFAEKKRLQKELEKSRNIIEEKQKEMEKLQEEVNRGVLLVDGEKEALEGNETKYFPLFAERSYKEGSADQLHFRLAESQFYRLLGGNNFRIIKVEYVINPKLVAKFKKAQEEIKTKRGEEFSYPILAFHGTDQNNITPICEKGFKVPGDKGFKHKTDTGYYGAGVYFSEFPSYAMGYIRGGTKLLLSQVVQGKIFKCQGLIQGRQCEDNYDSHISPSKKEIVIFHSDHILPQYIVHYKQGGGDFRYIKPKEQRKDFPGGRKLKELFEEADKLSATKVLESSSFKLSGRMIAPQNNIKSLITRHGGIIAAAGSYGEINVSTIDEWNKLTRKATNTVAAFGVMSQLNTLTVREDFIYDSIIAGEKADLENYALDD